MSLPPLTEFIEQPTVSAHCTKDFDPNLLKPRVPTAQDTELIVQLRTAAGWDTDKADKWLKMTEEGIRLQWIFELPESGSIAVGMCAVDLEDYLNDPEVASRAAKTVSFTSLVVLPEFRGKGYARWMATYAEKETKRCLSEKVEWITMTTLSRNTVSLKLHQGLGYEIFKEGDRYQQFYPNERLPPTLYLRKRLISDTNETQ